MGALVERATGRRWSDLFDQRLARPLGRTHTVWTHPLRPDLPPTDRHNPTLQGGVVNGSTRRRAGCRAGAENWLDEFVSAHRLQDGQDAKRLVGSGRNGTAPVRWRESHLYRLLSCRRLTWSCACHEQTLQTSSNARMHDDVPSPIDLRLMSDAREWEATALEKRPWRTEFFAQLQKEIAAHGTPCLRILELGSGPGFLAEHLLRAFSSASYVALDFSSAMHELAATRLGSAASRVEFVNRSFRDSEWSDGLGRFDCVVTHQAVHELRHKRHARSLHAAVRQILEPGCPYLVCDHFAGKGGMQNDRLYMTVTEQQQALHVHIAWWAATTTSLGTHAVSLAAFQVRMHEAFFDAFPVVRDVQVGMSSLKAIGGRTDLHGA